MKAKKFNKKLALNKNTVANLNNDDMSAVYGGVNTNEQTVCITNCVSDCVCPTWKPSKCVC